MIRSLKESLLLQGIIHTEIQELKKFYKMFFLKKKFFFYFKRKFLPELNELKKIHLYCKKIKPDLIIAIGGGAVLDYAKIANILDDLTNIEQKIKKYSYPIKKKNTS